MAAHLPPLVRSYLALDEPDVATSPIPQQVADGKLSPRARDGDSHAQRTLVRSQGSSGATGNSSESSENSLKCSRAMQTQRGHEVRSTPLSPE